MMPRLLVCALIVLSYAGASAGRVSETLPAETLPYDHVHLRVPDADEAAAWFLDHLNAQPKRSDDWANRVRYGGFLLVFTAASDAKPSTGSSVDHIGFSVADVDATMRSLAASGATIITPVRGLHGLFRGGIVERWGVRIEILEDPDTPGFHHIHLRLPDPEAVLDWYVEIFGGERTKLNGQLDAVRYTNPDLWLFVERGEGAPSEGHAIDHIGWRPIDMERTIAHVRANNVTVTREPRLVRGLPIAMLRDPFGVKVELVQR